MDEDFFSHLDDGLASADDAAMGERLRAKAEAGNIMPLAEGHPERCPACRGSGSFISYSGRNLGPCRKCKGKGQLFFRQPREAREHAKALRENRKARTQAEQLAAFTQAHPDEWAWMQAQAGSFQFATSMVEAVTKYGDLTERQLAAVQKCVQREKDRVAEKAQREANAPEIRMGAIEATFSVAKASGLHYPKLRLAQFVFALAGPHSRNPGAIYVTLADDKVYLGKIAGGRFLGARGCNEATLAAILSVAADPKAAAVAYGKEYGYCACCGAELSNPESVARGIGPICASKWGF